MKKKIIGAGLLSSLFVLAFSGQVFAGQWSNTEMGWQYLDKDSVPMTGVWQESNDKWFYIGEDGYMLTSTLIQDGDNYYYLDEDGSMSVNAWKQIKRDNEDEYDWYYFGSNGKAYRSRSTKVSPKQIGDKKYLFDQEGRMFTGFVNAGGEVVEADDGNDFVDAMYYFGEDGAMYQNAWLKFETVGNSNMRSALAQREYSSYAEMWLYFGENGKKVKAADDTKAKLKEINGKTYAFDEYGIMMPGLSVDNATMPAGDYRSTIRYGNVDENGALTGEYWTFRVPTEEMDEDEFNSQEYSWFRTRSNGKVYKNRIYTVNGRKYVFDSIGRMQSGFVIMLPNGRFGIQFDADEWNKEDFLVDPVNSPIPSIDRGDLYFFSVDDLNDGSMKTGKNLQIQLNDELATFGFKPNGRAYGSKGKLEKADKAFYYNGVKMEASSDFRFGLVDTNLSPAVTDYAVVNDKGITISGRRVLKDAQGMWIVIERGKFVARIGDTDKPRWRNGQYWRYDSSLRGADRYIEPITFATHGFDNIEDGFILFEH